MKLVLHGISDLADFRLCGPGIHTVHPWLAAEAGYLVANGAEGTQPEAIADGRFDLCWLERAPIRGRIRPAAAASVGGWDYCLSLFAAANGAVRDGPRGSCIEHDISNLFGIGIGRENTSSPCM